MSFIIEKLESADDALALAQKLKSDGRYDLFRGQSQNWPVTSSYIRCSEEDRVNAESRLNHFYSWASRTKGMEYYVENEDALLAVAQHYGLPTTLVDFSTCPRVAAFFATDGATDGDTSCIILVNRAKFENLISMVTKNNPKLRGEIEILDLETPNLWRLEAQKGLFLNLSVMDFEKIMFPFDRILFTAGGQDKFKRTNFYPDRKSDLERLLDHFFMEEAGIIGNRNIENLPNIHFITIEDDNKLFRKNAISSEISAHPSWNAPEIIEWVEGSASPEYISELSTDNYYIDCTDISDVPASPKAQEEMLLDDLNKGNLDRNELYKFEIKQPTYSNIDETRIVKGIERIWDGMRRLPYQNCDVAAAISNYILMCFMPSEYNDKILGDTVQVEFSGAGGSYSRATVSTVWNSFGVREDILSYVNSALTQKLSKNIIGTMQCVWTPCLLFEFDVFCKKFAREIIPSQEYERPEKYARFYSPYSLTRFGLS